MGIKRIILVASMAFAAIAVAGPASASALEWTKHSAPLEANEKIGLTGTLELVIPTGAMDCEVHAEAKLTANTSTGEVEKIEITTNTCKGTGSLTNCQVVNDTVAALPWTMHITAALEITITDMTITLNNKAGTGCPIPATVFHIPTVTAKPDFTEVISSLELSGAGTGGTGITMNGSLSVTPKATYGVF
ncbi:MAG TPA: hypothetical protein VNP96_07920 [Solirubrobacterales bacterium]|nr:hypothetical protein [Solirubrobacterales bacterium]